MQVKHLLLIAILALTAACSSKEVIDENLSEVELYQQAQADLEITAITAPRRSSRRWNHAIRSVAMPIRHSSS